MKRLMIMMALLVAQSPAYAWSTQWEEDHFNKATAIWLVTMPWRVTIRAAKLVVREVISARLILKRRYAPQECDYRAAQVLGDR